MNWTGGRLQRHSQNAKRGVIQKQKAFFAKARAKLQNGKSNPTAPFRPSYLHDDDLMVGNRRSGYGSGTTRHAAHSRRFGARNASDGPSALDVRHSARASHSGSEQRTFVRNRQTILNHEVDWEAASQHPARSKPPTPHRSGPEADAAYLQVGTERAEMNEHGNKQADDMETEDRLLEANRRRLLKRQDWAGLVPSRPLELMFESRREKHKIGRRRKLEGRPDLPQDRAMAVRRPHIHTDRNPGRPMRGASENDEDISIRIGTDALTSLTPVRQGHYAHLHGEETAPAESSDPMLFDNEEDANVVLQPSMEAACAMSQELAVSRAPELAQGSVNAPPPPTRRRDEATPVLHPHENGDATLDDGRRNGISRAAHGGSVEESGSIFQITRHIGGIGDPLRLVFDAPSDMLRNVSDNAQFSNSGRATSERGNERGSIRMRTTHAPSSPIIDDAPWRALAAIPGQSSHRSGQGRDGLSCLLQTHAAKDQNGFDNIVGSQYATVGDNTRISVSSRASASLPSIRWPGKRDTRPGPSYTESGRLEAVSQKQWRDIEDSERLWRQFVFIDDKVATSERTIGDSYDEDEDDGKSDEAVGERKVEGLPSSLGAASFISSRRIFTPFDTAPRLTSGATDGMRNAAGSATSLSTSSGSVLRQFPRLRYLQAHHQEDDLHDLIAAYAPATLEHGGFGEQSMTDASLQNNVSCDTDETLEGGAGDSRTF